MVPTRDEAWQLLCRYVKSEALREHALTVEKVMRVFAREAGEDQEYWGVAGLLHDLDYEMYPERHCEAVAEIMGENGIDASLIRAVQSHGFGLCVQIAPERYMEKALFAVDELTGLIHAAQLLRPSRSVSDMELKSLKKKYKSPGFAAGVNRAVIERGAQMLGIELDALMQKTLDAMKEGCA